VSSTGSGLRRRRRAGRGGAGLLAPVALGAAAPPPPPPIAPVPAGGAAAAAPPHVVHPPPAGGGGEPPLDTGIFSRVRPDVPAAASNLSWTERAVGAWMVKDCKIAAGTRLLAVLKDERFNADDLPKDARALHRRLEKSMTLDMPQFPIESSPLDLTNLETQPPPKQWRQAAVVNRGVLPCLVSALLNPLTSDWNTWMHYDPAVQPYADGCGGEPFHSRECRRLAEDAIQRFMAKGWKREDILVLPVAGAYDPMVPDAVGKKKLAPTALWLLMQILEVRRSLSAGEHWGLFPDTSLSGKVTTEPLKRDKRRALQAAFYVFTRQFNTLRERGFVIHGSWIRNCPKQRPLLCAPWYLADALDAVARWQKGNSKFFYCYVCPAGKDASKVYPAAEDLLEPRLVEPVAGLRRTANSTAVTEEEKTAKRLAHAELKDVHHVHPELTAHDELAAAHSGGKLNCYVDELHTTTALAKHFSKAIKAACDDPAAVEGTGRSVKTAAKVLNDHVAAAEHHSSGYHTLPGVYDFLGMESYTAMTVRSLMFSLLATFCSVKDLFETVRQTKIIRSLTLLVQLLQNANLREWDASVPDNIDGIFEDLGKQWPPAVGKWETFQRSIVHLVSHWRQQYTELGTPVHWTTKDFIEALQRVLRSAYLRTNLNAVEPQIMRRMQLVKYIDTIIEPSLCADAADGRDVHVVAALLRDRRTQAYLQGSTVLSVAGVNCTFDAPASAAQSAWNTSVRSAMRACADTLQLQCFPGGPGGHIPQRLRFCPRNSCFVSRRGRCARSVPAYPSECLPADATDCAAEHAIFSIYEYPQQAGAAAGGAAAAAARPKAVESKTEYFLVDGWFSYDTRSLSPATPNALPPPKRLTASELNGKACIDLCFGRYLSVQASVTGSGIAERDYADDVLKRLRLKDGKLAVLEVGALCQPLWAFPWLRDYDTAHEFFSRPSYTKWDAEQWLVTPRLY